MSTVDTPTGVDLTRVHMIGIGGAGMSGLARILADRGYTVTGSDAKDSRVLLALRSAGAMVAVGHDASNLTLSGQLPTVVVVSMAAIPKDNPELVAAAEHGIPVMYRSDLLAELMRGYRQVLFAGTHGKTSTTSMAVVAFQTAGQDPSFAIGGQLNKAGTNAHHGTGDVFIAEADESDASLLSYRPRVAVITNIEPDHLDFFHTPEAYMRVFDDFCDRVTDDGHVVVCLDDDRAAQCGRDAAARGHAVVGYGTSHAVASHPDIPVAVTVETIAPVGTRTSAVMRLADGTVHEVSVAIPGLHMVLNAAAALASGVCLGIDSSLLAEGISAFTGVRRRFELKSRIESGPYRGTSIFDDYAHHPTEVEAVLTATTGIPRPDAGPVIAVFQPHLYSRTMTFAAEFAAALDLADVVIICDIYPAREQPVEGVDGRIIADKLTTRHVYEPRLVDVPARVAEVAGPDSIVLTIGAGSVTVLGEEIAAALTPAGTGGDHDA